LFSFGAECGVGLGLIDIFYPKLSGFWVVFPLLYMEGGIVVSYSGIDSRFIVLNPLDIVVWRKQMDNFLKLKSYVLIITGIDDDIILDRLGITLTPLEQRIYQWGRDNWKQLVDLLDNNITEETIRDYMLENSCEDLPIEWVVNLISTTR
jgi:hypothetical protein